MEQLLVNSITFTVKGCKFEINLDSDGEITVNDLPCKRLKRFKVNKNRQFGVLLDQAIWDIIGFIVECTGEKCDECFEYALHDLLEEIIPVRNIH